MRCLSQLRYPDLLRIELNPRSKEVVSKTVGSIPSSEVPSDLSGFSRISRSTSTSCHALHNSKKTFHDSSRCQGCCLSFSVAAPVTLIRIMTFLTFETVKDRQRLSEISLQDAHAFECRFYGPWCGLSANPCIFGDSIIHRNLSHRYNCMLYN